MNDTSLGNIREEILLLDRALLEFIAKMWQDRMPLLERVALIKRADGRPMRDEEQEKLKLEFFKRESERLGLPWEMVEGIFQAIMDASVHAEDGFASK